MITKEVPDNTNVIGTMKIGSQDVLLRKGEAEEVIELALDPDDDPGKILERAKDEIKKVRWWSWEYYENKGLPKEQFELTDGKHEVVIYNFGEQLSPHHIEGITRVLGLFSGIRNGKALDKVKYIVLDDDQPINDKNGDLQNGYGPTNTKLITLYPNTLRPIQNRVTEKVSNLEGTLVHELTHGLEDEILEGEGGTSDRMVFNIWRRIGNWHIGDLRTLPGGAVTADYTDDPDRCVTDYAKADPGEDLCESNVAALFDPEKLDSEKRKFLQDNFSPNLDQVSKWQVNPVTSENIKFPDIPEEFGVKFRGGTGIKILFNSAQ